MKKGLAIAIVLGLLLAAYPIYGEELGASLWKTGTPDYGTDAETYTVSGTVEDISMEYSGGYISLKTTDGKVFTLVVKGEWTVGNKTMEYSDLLHYYMDIGDNIGVEYIENPRWGPMAEQIVLQDGSTAYKEVV